MKKILFILVSILFVVSCGAQGWLRKDVIISLDQIHTDAAFKQFKKATKMNQAEILNEFLRQANTEYKECDTIDQIRDLRENVVLIQRYLASGKQSFMSAQKEYNILFNKINKTIREYEGGTTIYNETGGYYDFGQELN
ncbi:MAG: hypothetical protein J6A22_07285 [Bacteroidales bacterium]|nr:hypothetical protein [Bacteroidales bacterium]